MVGLAVERVEQCADAPTTRLSERLRTAWQRVRDTPDVECEDIVLVYYVTKHRMPYLVPHAITCTEKHHSIIVSPSSRSSMMLRKFVTEVKSDEEVLLARWDEKKGTRKR